MYLEEFEKAEAAFDTYIQLSPDIANPYDSKGDFYMATEQYQSAYESYKKAYALDSGFVISAKKAKKAKVLLEESFSP
jgi:tetratricopeptide (TPR) repeat protein